MAQSGGAVKFTAVKPQLMVKTPKAVDAVQFYKTAFGAVEAGRSACCPQPNVEQDLTNFLCAQLELAGSSFVVYNDESAPVSSEGIGCQLCLETDDVEAAISKALSAGAIAEGEITKGGGSVVAVVAWEGEGPLWIRLAHLLGIQQMRCRGSLEVFGYFDI